MSLDIPLWVEPEPKGQNELTESGIHGSIHRFEAFVQESSVGFVLVVQRLSFTRKAQVKKGAGQYAFQREDSQKAVSNSALNWVLEGAWTTVKGRLSHAATSLSEKKFCLVNVWALSLQIFLPCPRCPLGGDDTPGKAVKHRKTRVVVHEFDAGNHFPNGSFDTPNECYVFRVS
ncbi:hypothetical protein CSKR_104713 [Clonorchis sinensis]|uniref:Uncharacterized protein n=1 Tax=Clonorchis sinensis TaxID=79923 RepID=A0A3R7H0W9_CLOSI|nr:hypothetical protein CSKR_104713 [Clonorchis sinensis]